MRIILIRSNKASHEDTEEERNEYAPPRRGRAYSKVGHAHDAERALIIYCCKVQVEPLLDLVYKPGVPFAESVS
jgi:hypothetical protein